MNPRDDLNEMDVARKALILARLLGQRIDLDNIKVESLYPEEMGPNIMHVEDFLVNGLPLLDKGIQERVERASSNGNVLRYVCVIEDSRAAVMWVDEQDGEAIELAFMWVDVMQVMTTGQRVTIEYHGNGYIFTVNQAGVKGQVKSNSMERGMISPDTYIVFQASNSSGIKIVNGPEVLSKFVGETEKNVRDLFADAEQDQRTQGDQSDLHVIIFDEIDAICKSRGSTRDGIGVHDSIVNQLLTKIDGVESLNSVLLIGMGPLLKSGSKVHELDEHPPQHIS
ncbi:unnamed protein product [Camellia sinensis]